jgi:hypothetical protein
MTIERRILVEYFDETFSHDRWNDVLAAAGDDDGAVWNSFLKDSKNLENLFLKKQTTCKIVNLSDVRDSCKAFSDCVHKINPSLSSPFLKLTLNSTCSTFIHPKTRNSNHIKEMILRILL